jgi:hypothetical protein
LGLEEGTGSKQKGTFFSEMEKGLLFVLKNV